MLESVREGIRTRERGKISRKKARAGRNNKRGDGRKVGSQKARERGREGIRTYGGGMIAGKKS